YANGLRQSASACYLKPVLARKNLRVMTNTLVQRVIVESGRATGIEYIQNGKKYSISAGEIILAGGAINSPQVLQLSGIGNPEHLHRHHIDVVHELPGVGGNLKDHISIAVKQRSTKPYSLLSGLKPLAIAKS